MNDRKLSTVAPSLSVRLPSDPSLLAICKLFVAFVESEAPNTIRIRSLREKNMEVVITYQHQLSDILSSQYGYLAVSTIANEVEVFKFVSEQPQLILSLRKKSLTKLWMQHNTLIMKGKHTELEILSFRDSRCQSKRKYSCGVSPKEVVYVANTLYLLCEDGSVGRLELDTQKYTEVVASKGLQDIAQAICVLPCKNGGHRLALTFSSHIDIIDASTPHKLLSIRCNPHSRVFAHRDRVVISSESQAGTVCQLMTMNKDAYESGINSLPLLSVEPSILIEGAGKLVLLQRVQTTEEGKKVDGTSFSCVQICQSHLKFYDIGCVAASSSYPQHPPQPKNVSISSTLFESLGKLIDAKFIPLNQKIDSLCKRVAELQRRLNSNYTYDSLKEVYRQSLKEQLICLLQTKIIPRMDQHFQTVFSKLAELSEQNIDYYRLKLKGFQVVASTELKMLMEDVFQSTRNMVEHVKQQCANLAVIQTQINGINKMKNELLRKTDSILDEIRKGPFGLQLIDLSPTSHSRDKFGLKT